MLFVPPIECEEVRRGPVRLRVDIPVAPFVHPRIVAAAIVLVGVLVVAVTGQPVLLLPTAFCLGLTVLVLREFARPLSRIETLEVDTRYVTVSRGDKLVWVWGRRLIQDVHTNQEVFDSSGRPKPRLARVPTVVWGRDRTGAGRSYAGGVGSGLTLETAESLVSAIREFCEEHPPDPDFRYHGSGMAVG